jgi:hypothetical protein
MDAEIFEATNRQYHGTKGLSNSLLQHFDRDPVSYYHKHISCDWPIDPPTPEMEFGTAVHRLIEYQLNWAKLAIYIPADVLNKDGHKRGLRWKKWAKENWQHEHLKPGQLNHFEVIAQNVVAHRRAQSIVCHPKAHRETNIRWRQRDMAFNCKARLDLVIPGTAVVDVKTIYDVDRRVLQSEIERRRYYRQLAFYRDAWNTYADEVLPCFIVAIQNKPGYAVEVVELAQHWIDRGHEENIEVMQRLQEAHESGDFYPDTYREEQNIVLDPPRWAGNEERYELS